MKQAIEPFEKDPQSRRRQDGDHGRAPLAVESADSEADRARARAYKPTWYEDPIRMNSPQALAEYPARPTSGSAPARRWARASPTRTMLDRDAMHVVMRSVLDRRPHRGPQDRRMAETYHRPFAPHDCIGPIGFIAAIHMSFSQPNTLIQESVRAFYKAGTMSSSPRCLRSGTVSSIRWKVPASVSTFCPPYSTAPILSCAAPTPKDPST